jgi:hypothetical protein
MILLSPGVVSARIYKDRETTNMELGCYKRKDALIGTNPALYTGAILLYARSGVELLESCSRDAESGSALRPTKEKPVFEAANRPAGRAIHRNANTRTITVGICLSVPLGLPAKEIAAIRKRFRAGT